MTIQKTPFLKHAPIHFPNVIISIVSFPPKKQPHAKHSIINQSISRHPAGSRITPVAFSFLVNCGYPPPDLFTAFEVFDLQGSVGYYVVIKIFQGKRIASCALLHLTGGFAFYRFPVDMHPSFGIHRAGQHIFGCRQPAGGCTLFAQGYGCAEDDVAIAIVYIFYQVLNKVIGDRCSMQRCISTSMHLYIFCHATAFTRWLWHFYLFLDNHPLFCIPF